MSVADTGLTRPGEPGEGAVTRYLHRLFFSAVGLLPGASSRWARTRIFNGLFTAGTPWPYAQCPYERAKREHLVASVPENAHTIMEIGCADGHNLQAIAAARPAAHVVGVDISDRACDLARMRTLSQPGVEVVHADSGKLVESRTDLHGSVDAIVTSEVLYYLGTGRQFHQQVAPLRSLLTPQGCVIAVHTCADALDLHRRAAKALDLTVAREQQVALAERSFTISVLTPRT